MTHCLVAAGPRLQAGALMVGSRTDWSPLTRVTNAPSTFVEAVHAGLAGVAPRHAKAFRLYCGIGLVPHTLEGVGGVLGVTRERARQLRELAWKRIVARDPQVGSIAERVMDLLHGRTTPLTLGEMEAWDPWFAGISDARTLLEYALDRAGNGRFRCWELDGQRIVTRAALEHWGALCVWTRAFLRQACERGLTKGAVWAEMERRTDAIQAPELTGALWESIVGSPYDGPEGILTTVGTSRIARIAGILRTASAPMSWFEFARALGEEARLAEPGYAYSNRLRNDIRAAGGLLFGRGLFGRADHLNVSDREIADIIAEVEYLLQDVDSSRQWHAKELLAMLQLERPDSVWNWNAYELSLMLAQSTVLRYHGRFIWSLRDAEGAPTERLAVARLCEQALEQRGTPMSTQELISAVRTVRGVNDTFLLIPSGRLVRVAPGQWGLVDRDIGVSPAEAARLMDHLFMVLGARQSGLHLNELEGVLYIETQLERNRLDSGRLWGLAQRDSRFTCSHGWLLGLAEWEGPRRLTNIEAAQRVQELGLDRLTSDEAHELLERYAMRSIPPRAVSVLMASSGYVYDADSRGYQLVQVEGVDDGEE